MKKSLLLALVCWLSSSWVLAGDAIGLKAGHPDSYVVKKGDTLWDISGIFLNKPWLWPEIWHVNPQIRNPHLIYPGDVLNLVYIDGKPRLMLSRGGPVKLSPKVKISDLNSAINTIPLNVIAPFMSGSRIVGEMQLESAPYVLAGKEGRIIGGAGDVFYARGAIDPDIPIYGIYRRHTNLIDPVTKELLGVHTTSIGRGEVLDIEGNIGTLALIETSEEVRRGDLLLRSEDKSISANFIPKPPGFDIDGYIIAVEGGVSQVGSMDVVIINKGRQNNIEPGHVLSIWRTGKTVRDVRTKEMVKLPDTDAGLLMVFRTFDKVSYALVLEATMPLSVMDSIHQP